MNMIPKNLTKDELWTIALANVKNRYLQTGESIEKLRQDLSNEQKSTAGDKYETGRAMIHAEIDRLSAQLSTINEELNYLNHILSIPKNEKISAGSIVLLKDRIIYLSIGLGNEKVDGNTISFVSTKSPLGTQLLGKVKGDSVIINKQQLEIMDVK